MRDSHAVDEKDRTGERRRKSPLQSLARGGSWSRRFIRRLWNYSGTWIRIRLAGERRQVVPGPKQLPEPFAAFGRITGQEGDSHVAE